jgi:hypothetical protein
MYALIIVIAVLSPAGGAVTPVGVTSQVVGKFKNLDQCKAAASQQSAGGAISPSSADPGGSPRARPWHDDKSVRADGGPHGLLLGVASRLCL